MHKFDHLTSIKKWIEKLKVSFGSKIDDSHSGPKGPFTVLLGSLRGFSELPFRSGFLPLSACLY